MLYEHTMYNAWAVGPNWYPCIFNLCMSSVASFFKRKFERTFVLTFTRVVFLEGSFTCYSSNLFLQNTFTFTQVVVRAITFTFTQIPKTITRLNFDDL